MIIIQRSRILRIVSIFVLINEVINKNVENIMMLTRPIPVVLIIDIGNDFFFFGMMMILTHYPC